MATVVLGAQWGDEGKGKIVDVIAGQGIQLCCRAQGGHNAGHTIVKNGTTFDVHILPSGVLTEGCLNLIGSGCVVYVPGFLQEIDKLEKHGIATKGRVVISSRCHVLLDLHVKVDGLEEVELGKASIGTTKKGIGPAYQTKVARTGIRFADIGNKKRFDEQLRRLSESFRKRFGDLIEYDPEEEIARFDQYRELLEPYIVDQTPLINKAVDEDWKMLVEGANALLLDIDNGTYPFVTSSSTGIGGIFTGLSLDHRKIREVVGVVKAYSTRVGSGPFPTEQLDAVGERLQQVGKEWGVTTGRKRRCGWLDLVSVRYSNMINHYDALNLTKIDVLDDFDEIKVAVGYRLNGKSIDVFPSSHRDLPEVEAVYETLPGWKSSTFGLRKWDELPAQAKSYVEFIESFVRVKIKYIGTGPGSDNMIVR